MERKMEIDTRAEEGNTGRRKTGRLVSIVSNIVLGGAIFFGGLLGGCKTIEENYQRGGIHRGRNVEQAFLGGNEKNPKNWEPKIETNWAYEIYEKNGKTYFKGNVYDVGDKKYYEGEIFCGNKSKKIIDGREEEVVKLKSGKYYGILPYTQFIGETPDESIIVMAKVGLKNPRPIIIPKEWYETIESSKKKGPSKTFFYPPERR